MEMTYDGALVMPMGCALMDEDEMMYMEGGAYLSYSKVKNFMLVYLAAYSVAPAFVAAKTVKYCAAIANVVGRFTSWVGTILGGGVGAIVGYLIGAFSGMTLAYNVVKALIQQKGISITWEGFSVK